MTKTEFTDICSELSEEYFPKGKCKERGKLIVFIAKLYIKLSNEGVIKDA